MKKALLILTLLFSGVSSSFAGWESGESIWFNGFDANYDPQVNNQTLYANINAYVDYIGIFYNVSYLAPGGGYVDMGVLSSSSNLYYQYVNTQSSSGQYFVSPSGSPSYWGTITTYIESYGTNGSIILRWGQI